MIIEDASTQVLFCDKQYVVPETVKINGIDILKRISELATAELSRSEDFPFCEIIKNNVSDEYLDVSIEQQNIDTGLITLSIEGSLVNIDIESNTIFRSYIGGFIPWGLLKE